MNLVIIMGRFTRDPEVRVSADSRNAVARCSIAVDRRFKQEGQPEADFFNLVAFGKTAEFIEKYFYKGMKAVVTGELRNNNYTDQQGVKHYNNDIIVSSIEFAESKKDSANNTATNDMGFMNVPDGIVEELPFT